MARRRTYTRRVYSRAKRGYRRRKGLLSGNVGQMAYGAIGGIVGDMIPPVIGGWTKPLAFGAIGYLTKKSPFFVMAGYEAGKMLNPFGNSSNGGIFKGQSD